LKRNALHVAGDGRRQHTPPPHLPEGPVVFIGGVIEHKKLAWAERVFGADIEWAPSRRGPTMEALARRIRRGRVRALVVLEHLVSHRQYEVLIEAARSVRLPVAYARKAGQAALARAFASLDLQGISPSAGVSI
jgi:hypothetical protein